ncbi:hypothetical protein [Arcobacter sp. KX21116]|uniref:hypothetical protein n=1 Tax=Arcobacter TaxID=28196 RepID=UPI0035D3E189
MNRLVIDSNIIDYCSELGLTKSFFENLDIEIWVPTYVKNEILNSKKEKLINKLSEIEFKRIGFFGFADNPNALSFGQGSFYSNEYDDFINNTSEKHRNDRFIALLSKINNAIFMTSDNKIFKDVCINKVRALFISKDEKSYNKAIQYSEHVYYNLIWTKEKFRKIIDEGSLFK